MPYYPPPPSGSGALDPDLVAIAALTGTGYARRTAPDTWTLDAGSGGGGGGRELLTAPRDYFVGGAGASDANNGLTVGTPFATIQRAVDVIAGTLDIGAKVVTVKVAAGTYNENVTLKNVAGYGAYGNLVIKGSNPADPAAVHVTATGTVFSAAALNSVWELFDMKVTGSNSALSATGGSVLRFGNLHIGAGASQLAVSGGSILKVVSGYRIVGGATGAHLQASGLGTLEMLFMVIEVAASLTFLRFANAAQLGFIEATETYFVPIGGSPSPTPAPATGTRYSSHSNSVINVGGRTHDVFPGNAAGAVSAGGIYL